MNWRHRCGHSPAPDPVSKVRRMSLQNLAATHDVFLIDQFGTVHDGTHPYPGALDALYQLRAMGKQVALLSNSGRRAGPNAERLAKIGVPDDAYDLNISSGEVAYHMLAAGILPEATGASRCLLISRDHDCSMLEGNGLTMTNDPQECDLVIIGGSEGEKVPLADYRTLLAPAAARRVPALCVNPDLVMLTPRGQAFGAGRIAELYIELGGLVRWIGKPFPSIYDYTLRLLGDPPRERVVAIGDSVRHDIKGARAAGCHAVLVLTGIAGPAVLDDELHPDMILPGLRWDARAVREH
ncbi:Hydrolase (HAD superfamily) [Granulibacter bethesdensis]|uniref:Hydrolase (HAD superfamily) n=2 Tax=Granulibacter bethesdensis TaxID=364410 RepID=Q0BPW5_GRABC|nr:Hydrolase (HAD superfamily) [Granulibacter bethesdensis CGDNIH1]AHJ67893.1 Hydrolase (HAD superfamily) [Granulibacter bethesdensis]APH53013.1 Hydrolase (HAD superfamily) [Granulibacter bethesdensis]APH65701.1 Hydrolase (HAD superfamily) [Granulibacter bethesdensis]